MNFATKKLNILKLYISDINIMYRINWILNADFFFLANCLVESRGRFRKVFRPKNKAK